MAKRNPDYAKRYEELMRNAGARKRTLAARALDNERRFRAEQQRIAQQRTGQERTDRVQRDLRRHAEQLRIAALIERELAQLRVKLEAATESEEKILLKAEIAHLLALKTNLTSKPFRKPPESGIPVPAVPPGGPPPKQGGAEAPLDFGRD